MLFQHDHEMTVEQCEQVFEVTRTFARNGLLSAKCDLGEAWVWWAAAASGQHDLVEAGAVCRAKDRTDVVHAAYVVRDSDHGVGAGRWERPSSICIALAWRAAS